MAKGITGKLPRYRRGPLTAGQPLDPAQTHYLRSARQRLLDNYKLSLNQNKYQRRTLGNQYTRGRADLRRQFADARLQLPGDYAGAGLLNSGIWQQALSRFGQERQAAFGNLRGQYDDQRAGLDLARAQLGTVKRQGLQDLQAEEAARRAALAASIRGVR